MQSSLEFITVVTESTLLCVYVFFFFQFIYLFFNFFLLLLLFFLKTKYCYEVVVKSRDMFVLP